jgi:hypothetical protein
MGDIKVAVRIEPTTWYRNIQTAPHRRDLICHCPDGQLPQPAPSAPTMTRSAYLSRSTVPLTATGL